MCPKSWTAGVRTQVDAQRACVRPRFVRRVPGSDLRCYGLALALLLSGCSCGAAEKRESTTQAAPQSRSDKSQVEPEEKEREPKGRLGAEYHPNRGLSIRLEQLEGRDEYAGKVSLEAKSGDAWKPVEGVELSLHPSCDKFDTCRVLRQGGAALPPAYVWPVKIGAKGTADAECACEACMDLAPGEYRLVAKTCGGAHRLTSDSFWVAERPM